MRPRPFIVVNLPLLAALLQRRPELMRLPCRGNDLLHGVLWNV